MSVDQKDPKNFKKGKLNPPYKPAEHNPNPLTGSNNLSIAEFSEMNRLRNDAWIGNKKQPNLNELAVGFFGEAGELCNVVKKLTRNDEGIRGNLETARELEHMIAEEIADCVIMLDLLANHFQFDLTKIVVQKFNKTSEKVGLHVFKLDE